MGFDDGALLATIAGMTGAMLFKSMTTHRDSALWQDVYHAPLADGRAAYVKLTLRAGAVVIQFKGKE